MADLEEQDSMVSDGVASASYLMANLSHEESFFDESNQTILEKLPDEDSQMKETEFTCRNEEKIEKEKKDCRRSMCVRVKKEVCILSKLHVVAHQILNFLFQNSS